MLWPRLIQTHKTTPRHVLTAELVSTCMMHIYNHMLVKIQQQMLSFFQLNIQLAAQ